MNEAEIFTFELEKDYDLRQDDILKAKEIEKYHELFRLFTARDTEKITLCIAAVRTLARETDGIFSREDMDRVLSYLNTDTRVYVIKRIVKYGWIVSNGIRYQFPERMRHMMMFLFGVFNGEGDSFNREISVSLAVSDLDEVAGSDEQTSANNLQIAFGTLKSIRSQFTSSLEQRSPVEARKLLIRSRDIHEAMEKIEDRLKKINRNSYQYTQTTGIRVITAEIMRLSQELHEFIQQDIQANARSFGQYLTPEQVEEFLHTAPLELLTRLVQNNFSAPLKPHFLSQEELIRRGSNYLDNKPEIQELTPPPPITEIVERQFEAMNSEGAANLFYKELMVELNVISPIPLHKVVIKNNFGETLFHTGLLTTIRHEIDEELDKKTFEIYVDNATIELEGGFIDRITKGVVELVNQKNEKKE